MIFALFGIIAILLVFIVFSAASRSERTNKFIWPFALCFVSLLVFWDTWLVESKSIKMTKALV